MCVASILTLLWCGLGFLPLSAHGLWNCQAHFMEIRQPIVLSSSVAPSPHGSITFERTDPWGDGSRFRRWRFKVQGVTVQNPGDDGFDIDPWTVSTPDKMSGNHLWCMTRVILSSDIISNRSIAWASMHFLYKYHTSFLISLFSAENILLERIRCTCQRPLRSIAVFVINALPPFTNYFGKYFLFHKSPFLSYILFIFLDFIPLSPLLDPSES